MDSLRDRNAGQDAMERSRAPSPGRSAILSSLDGERDGVRERRAGDPDDSRMACWDHEPRVHMNSGRNMNDVKVSGFMFRPEFMWECLRGAAVTLSPSDGERGGVRGARGQNQSPIT